MLKNLFASTSVSARIALFEHDAQSATDRSRRRHTEFECNGPRGRVAAQTPVLPAGSGAPVSLPHVGSADVRGSAPVWHIPR